MYRLQHSLHIGTACRRVDLVLEDKREVTPHKVRLRGVEGRWLA
ncbi:MAG TPA: hypothetical protein VD948_11235 [Rhodothermales bacterium]|nr:hypothetical protein [Rhodothermales bacterium]